MIVGITEVEKQRRREKKSQEDELMYKKRLQKAKQRTTFSLADWDGIMEPDCMPYLYYELMADRMEKTILEKENMVCIQTCMHTM